MHDNNVNMSTDLTLGAIVTRAGLRLRTARYVLSHGRLPTMPRPTGRGGRRTFSHYQAVRLAICTRLVTSGINLETAVFVTKYWLQAVWYFEGPISREDLLFKGTSENPWLLTILDFTWVNVSRSKCEANDPPWFDKTLYGYIDGPPDPVVSEKQLTPLDRYTLNLTLLEQKLLRPD